MTTKVHVVGMEFREDKLYYLKLFQDFANIKQLETSGIVSVNIGKLSGNRVYSAHVLDEDGVVVQDATVTSRPELLGYVRGYVDSFNVMEVE